MIKELPVAIFSGLLFGAGLAVSGMADPSRVRGFLDVFGNWDPTLMFVMGAAVLVMAIAWFFQRRLSSPLISPQFSLPGTSKLDARLVVGAVLFGVGWGIAGLCPGPALIGLILKPASAVIFVAAMLLGMALFQIRYDRKKI
ncbi:GENE II AND X PROTEINS [hydrothermal vent metagenome]|uniref:GENE II AND X PROTEINS n=1 Tax=hydrothermal vent metagenome TaxID=652676 RepID=A0A3B0T9W3_9ZZZZ